MANRDFTTGPPDWMHDTLQLGGDADGTTSVDTDVIAVSPTSLAALRRQDFLGAFDAAYLEDITPHLTTNFVLALFLRAPMNAHPPPEYVNKALYVYFQQPDFSVPEAALPEFTPGGRTRWLRIYQRQTDDRSLGVAAPHLDTVPDSWEDAGWLYRVYMEQLNLSSDQQTSLAESISERIADGMGSSYTVDSTTARFIDFQRTGAGANDPLDTTYLQGEGWAVATANSLTRTINGFVWTVKHN